MGKIIRRTVTITITESWTIVWTDDVRADDKPQPQATTIVQEQPKPEKEDETILLTVTTDAATDAQPPDMSPKSGIGSQRKRTRRRRPVDPGAE